MLLAVKDAYNAERGLFIVVSLRYFVLLLSLCEHSLLLCTNCRNIWQVSASHQTINWSVIPCEYSLKLLQLMDLHDKFFFNFLHLTYCQNTIYSPSNVQMRFWFPSSWSRDGTSGLPVVMTQPWQQTLKVEWMASLKKKLSSLKVHKSSLKCTVILDIQTVSTWKMLPELSRNTAALFALVS